MVVFSFVHFDDLPASSLSALSRCEAFDERCSALLCALASVPGLKEVDLKVTRVNENWATRMLSLIQTCSGLHHVG